MSKKADQFYYDNFVESASIACEAAETLRSILGRYDVLTLAAQLDAMHLIEQRGDRKKHEMDAEILRAFITPIERNDILALSQHIDDVTDAVEDILIHLYINNVVELQPEAIRFAELLVRCCAATRALLEELPNFKHSKTIQELTIEIHHLEEEGDRLYIDFSAALHRGGFSTLTVLAWREVYGYFENACDACEAVAETVEGIVIDNT